MEKIIVELEAKTDKALKGIDSVAKSVEDLNKAIKCIEMMKEFYYNEKS